MDIVISNAEYTRAKSFQTDWLPLGTNFLTVLMVLFLSPIHYANITKTASLFSIGIFSILPAVVLLIGLFSVWVSREVVIKYSGEHAGLKGIILALFFGALPTGPLYFAFPLAAGLLSKGARIANIIIFLTAWACIKIPPELVELKFLGARFMFTRLSLTILAAITMGYIIEYLIHWLNMMEKFK